MSTAPWHFPRRNRLMALLARATVLVEASATSGTRHQVAACALLGRPIFVPAPLLDQVGWRSTRAIRPHVLTWHEPSEAVSALLERVAT
jgi:DNA processing protein